MPLDGFTLGLLADHMNAALSGARVDKVTQPESDEIILSVRSPGRNLMLLLSANAGSARIQETSKKRSNPLEPSAFCMLLRKRIAGSRIKSISQYQGDRILDIVFDTTNDLGDACELTITCECMGRHSNIILYDENKRIIDSVRRVTMDISRIRQVLPGLTYERPPMQDKFQRKSLDVQALSAAIGSYSGSLCKVLSSSIIGISNQTAEEITLCSTGNTDTLCTDIDAYSTAEKVVDWLKNANELDPCVYFDENNVPVEITAFPYFSRSHLRCTRYNDIGEAMDNYFSGRDDISRISQKSTALRHVIKRNIERLEKKLSIRMETIKESERMEEYRIKGELLNASINMIPKGAKVISLPNWYDENCAEIEIALDESVSPARNAQMYFKRYQKMRNAAKLAYDQAAETEEELTYLEGQLENLEKCIDESDLQEVRAELEKEGYVHANHNRRQNKALPPSKPMHYISAAGIDILVGKNNVQNEHLTFSAQSDEIWLHAKDMPGSHVVIKSTDPDEQTLSDAVMLAAFYSKGTSSSNVPVDVTRRRYVKKPSGTKPGFVTYTHQQTYYITPDERYIQQLSEDKKSST